LFRNVPLYNSEFTFLDNFLRRIIQEDKEEKLSLIKGTPSGNFILFYYPVFTFLKIKAEVLIINLLWIMFSSLSAVTIIRY
jgi:hypothetical protein